MVIVVMLQIKETVSFRYVISYFSQFDNLDLYILIGLLKEFTIFLVS